MAKFLTKDEELHLGGIVQTMVKAKEQLASDTNLSTELKKELSVQIKEGNDAVDKMVKANLRLVYQRARSFKRNYPSGPELEDMIQDGMAGLMTAILRYDPRRDNKLSTVATYWIFQSITRQANKTGRLVRLPENRVSDYSKIVKLRKEYELAGMEHRDIEDRVMSDLKLSRKDFFSISNAASTPASLNKEINDGESARELMDIIPQEDHESVENNVIRDAMKSALSEAMGNLSELEQDVVEAAFLFSKGESITPKEVKKKYKLETGQFETHLSAALKTIKIEMDSNGVSYDDFLEN